MCSNVQRQGPATNVDSYQLTQRSARLVARPVPGAGSDDLAVHINSGTANAYKPTSARRGPTRNQSSSSFCSSRAIVATVVAMVALSYFVKSLLCLAPLVTVTRGQYDGNGALPSLAEATTEELTAGLEAKAFTSMDLVNVCANYPAMNRLLILTIGIRRANPRS